MKNRLSKIAILANRLTYHTDLTKSEAWRKAWAAVRLQEAMQTSEKVEFSFVKVSTGEVRQAVGTLHPAIIPDVKGEGRIKPVNQITYFDLDRQQWRSFKAENLNLNIKKAA